MAVWGFPGCSVVKNLPAKQETQIGSLCWEGPLEEEIATHSSILTQEIPWTEKPGGLQFMGSQRVRHDLVTKQQQHLTKQHPTFYVSPTSVSHSVDTLILENFKGIISFLSISSYRQVFDNFTNIFAKMNCLSSHCLKFQFSGHDNILTVYHNVCSHFGGKIIRTQSLIFQVIIVQKPELTLAIFVTHGEKKLKHS